MAWGEFSAKIGRIGLACGVAGAAVAGCATHNRPQITDQIDYSLSSIVEKVKCEATHTVAAYASKHYRINAGVDNLKLTNSQTKAFDKKHKSTIDEFKEYERSKTFYEKLLISVTNEQNNESEKYNSLLKLYNDIKGDERYFKDKILIENLQLEIRKQFLIKEELKNRINFLKLKKINFNKENKIIIDKNKIYTSLKDTITKNHTDLIDYLSSKIQFRLQFDITEKNSASLGAVLGWPITHGTKNLDPSLGADLTRKGIQTIQVEATFNQLIEKDCSVPIVVSVGQPPKLYPVTGDTGVDSFISEFFEIRKNNKNKGKDDTFSDKITFTTQLDGGLKPSLKLVPVTGSTVNISGNLSAQRIDQHDIQLTIQRPKSAAQMTDPAPTETSIICNFATNCP